MSTTRKLWGELENETIDETLLQNVNFNPIIELGMQNIPEIPITVKSSPIQLPTSNLITQTILLHEHSRQLTELLEQAESTVFDAAPNIPEPPPEIDVKLEHEAILPINFLPKEYCEFSLGKGPVIQTFTPDSQKRALKQCAAIAMGHVGIPMCTNTVLDGVADVLDHFMTNMCKLLRVAVDRDASGLTSGFPDLVSKILTDLKIGNLQAFYENRVVRYHDKIKRRCEELRSQCEALAIPDIPPQLKLEDVPELHFPAALDGTFTPSLEPGFQMLHSLEQEQLQGLELLDVVADEIKLEPMEFSQAENTKLPSLSPTAKKIRKQ